jgi:hypothetical protein
LGAAMYLVASWRLRLSAFKEVTALVVRRKSPA